MRKIFFLFLWLSCLPFATRGQTIENADLSELLLPIQAKALCYWYDGDDGNIQTVSDLSGTYTLDVSSISDGLHTLHYQVIGTDDIPYCTTSKVFLKMTGTDAPSSVPLEGSKIKYWYDEDANNIQTVSKPSGVYSLDVSSLSNGMHTLHALLVGGDGTVCSTMTDVFIKEENIQTEENLFPTVAARDLVYWFDEDDEQKQTSNSLSGIYKVDVSSLSDGLHLIHYYVEGENSLVYGLTTTMFFKSEDMFDPNTPNGITKYTYWLNDSRSPVQTVTLDQTTNPYTLMALLPTPKQPIRSSKFHFQVSDGVPTIYAKNDFHIRFYDARGEFVDNFMEEERTFIDYSVSQEITDAELLEPNSSHIVDKPADNTIKWYYLQVEPGDSLEFKLDRTATIQLFAPSGKEVYNASGARSVKWGGCHVEEKGIYYAALHDVTAQLGTNVCIEYNHIDKYAILDVDIDEVGVAESFVPITIQGNGFDKLKSVSLSFNDRTITSTDNIVVSKGKLIAFFLLSGNEQLGNYTLNVEYEDAEDGIVTLSALAPVHMVSPEWGELIVEVIPYMSSVAKTMVKIRVTNQGNVARLYTPLTFAFDNIEHISQIDFENFYVLVSEELQESEHDPVVWTDNFARTGKEAVSTFFFIPSIKPKDIMDFTMTYHHTEDVNVHAVVGKSLNEEIAEAKDEISDDQPVDINSNDCTIAPSLSEYLFEHTDFDPGDTEDNLKDKLKKLPLPDFGEVLVEQVEKAEEASKNAIGIGMVVGNMINAIHLKRDLMVMNNTDFYSEEEKQALKNRVHLDPPSDILNAAGHPFIGGGAALWEWHQLKSVCKGDKLNTGRIVAWRTLDPNDIIGYKAESGSKAIKEGIKDVSYTIEFENTPEFATASAHTIVVNDTLDNSKFDMSTFAATGVKIGSKQMELGNEKCFSKRTMDFRPEVNVITQVSLSFDEQKSVATWTIESLDPMTMEPTEDALQGVLPVNYNGNGIGEVSYNISLKPNLTHGTEVHNRAGIVFDQNETIMTPTWTNIIDRIAPESHVTDVQMQNDSTATVRIAATDELSGPWRYNVYVQYGSGAWFLGAENVPADTTASVKVYEGINHGFYVVVTDSAGNVEQKEAAREFSFEVFAPQEDTDTRLQLAQGWNWISHNQQEALSAEALKPKAQRIVSQTDELFKDSHFGWTGTLDELQPTEMYKVQMAEADEVQLSGKLFNAAFRSVPLYTGWNWMGYPVANVMTPAEALQKMEAEEGDFIVGQDGMATFSEGQWAGTLMEMVPGQGYMYRSVSDKILFLNATAQASSRRAVSQLSASGSQLPEGWNVDKRKYPNVMGLVADLVQDGEAMDASEWLVAAFCGEECRGLSQAVGGHLMMNVFGTDGERITFLALNLESGEVTGIEESEPFRTDILGTMQQPYELHSGVVGGISLTPTPISESKGSVYMLDGRRVEKASMAKDGVYIVTDGNKTEKRVNHKRKSSTP